MSDDGFEVAPVKSSKESARAAYDNLSKWYDLLAGSSEKKFADIGLQKLDVKAGEKILESDRHGLVVVIMTVSVNMWTRQVCLMVQSKLE